MVSFEPLGLADLCQKAGCGRECRTGRHVNPDKSPSVRKSEVAPAKGCSLIDMEASTIIGWFNERSLFCSNRMVPHCMRIAVRKDA